MMRLGRTIWLLASLAAMVCATSGGGARNATQQQRGGCLRVSLSGEVADGKSWSAALGEGWTLQLVPISGASVANGPAYSGWDVAVNRVGEESYPDALLLATPPYGSLNAREIGTTYGMRAQDAIAWQPRHFRFLTSASDLTRARALYQRVMPRGAVSDAERRQSSAELLALLRSAAQGSGQLEVEDARLIPGTADPEPFAQAWAERLDAVPHKYEQAAPSSARGNLRWIRFLVTLWLPQPWKLRGELHGLVAKCAE